MLTEACCVVVSTPVAKPQHNTQENHRHTGNPVQRGSGVSGEYRGLAINNRDNVGRVSGPALNENSPSHIRFPVSSSDRCGAGEVEQNQQQTGNAV